MTDVAEYTEADVKAWREGVWVFVTLAGELVHKRLTRDPGFTHAVVIFSETRSPRYPTRQHFVRAELTGAWARPQYRGPSGSNRLTVPITNRTPVLQRRKEPS